MLRTEHDVYIILWLIKEENPFEYVYKMNL